VRGYAHSIETYRQGELVGGLYGVRLGGVFFGESMFSRERDASKVALAHLVHTCFLNDIVVIDCQLPSQHLESLGSRAISRANFRSLVREQALADALPLKNRD
jgi:leucyl/phenylalanyl-tRNA--protein transferase